MLSIDATLVVIFVLIWVLVLVLSKVFFKPVNRIMTDRDSCLAENKSAAKEALEGTERDIAKIEEDLKSAKAEADKAKEMLESEALKEKARFLSDLHAESRNEVDKARGEIDAQIVRLKSELSKELDRLAEKIEQRILH